MKTDKSIPKKIAHEEEYIAFLKKRIDSDNFKSNVTDEEYAATKKKYEKAKEKLKMLRILL